MIFHQPFKVLETFDKQKSGIGCTRKYCVCRIKSCYLRRCQSVGGNYYGSMQECYRKGVRSYPVQCRAIDHYFFIGRSALL